MASLSIARLNASLTLISLNGFFPLMFELRNSSTPWSIPKKIERTCATVFVVRPSVASIRFKSCKGASNTKSTSPDNNAATRVAAFLIGLYSMRSTFPGNIESPHQFEFRVSTESSSGALLVSINGPVPLEFRTENVSSSAAKSCGFSTPLAFAQPLSIMYTFVSVLGRIGFAPSVTSFTVKSSITSILATVFTCSL